MRAPRPEGFGFFALCALACACFMAVLLSRGTLHQHYLPLQRLAVGATGALALVAAEAIWCVRRWAFPASAALAAMFMVMLFLVLGDLTAGFIVSIPSLLLIASGLVTVRKGIAASLSGIHVPVPAARP